MYFDKCLRISTFHVVFKHFRPKCKLNRYFQCIIMALTHVS